MCFETAWEVDLVVASRMVVCKHIHFIWRCVFPKMFGFQSVFWTAFQFSRVHVEVCVLVRHFLFSETLYLYAAKACVQGLCYSSKQLCHQ